MTVARTLTLSDDATDTVDFELDSAESPTADFGVSGAQVAGQPTLFDASASTGPAGEDLFYTMLALSEVAPSFDGSDGGLLNGFFPDHHLWPPHLVAWKRTVSKFKMVWTDFSVSAVDFTGRPKPWHLSWLRRADPVDKVYYLPLFLEWWEKWFAYRKALPGSGGGASIHHWALGPL